MFWVKMYQNSVKMIKKRNFCFALSVLCFALLGHRMQEKANQVNDLIGKCCTQNNWGFLRHKTIDSTCLNAKGLHLNKKGTSIVAKSISNYIINN